MFSRNLKNAKESFIKITGVDANIIEQEQKFNTLANKFTSFQNTASTKYTDLESIATALKKISDTKGVVGLLSKDFGTSKKNGSFVTVVTDELKRRNFDSISSNEQEFIKKVNKQAKAIENLKLNELEQSLNKYLSQKRKKHPTLEKEIDRLKVLVVVWITALVSLIITLNANNIARANEGALEQKQLA